MGGGGRACDKKSEFLGLEWLKRVSISRKL